jgi:hypothetical protein
MKLWGFEVLAPWEFYLEFFVGGQDGKCGKFRFSHFSGYKQWAKSINFD